MIFVCPKGDVYFYRPTSRKDCKYVLVRITDDAPLNASGRIGIKAYLGDSTLKNFTVTVNEMFQMAYTIQYIERDNYEGYIGYVGKVSRDMVYDLVLYLIDKENIRILNIETMKDATVEWLQKSLGYNVWYPQRLKAEKLLSKLLAEEFD